MSDESTHEELEQSETSETKIESPPPPVTSSAPAGEHRLEELEKFRAEYRRELEARDNKTAEEIRQLKEELAKANAYIVEQKKALRSREEAKDSGSTIVIPPQQVARPAVQQQQAAADSDTSQPPKKRRLSWW